MKKILDYTLLSIDKGYYFKQLFWGALPFLAFLVGSPYNSFAGQLIIVLVLLFYPFTKLAWDYLIGYLFSDGPILILPVVVLFIWYIFRTVTLFFFTPILCPFVLGFLYWYNCRHEIEHFNG